MIMQVSRVALMTLSKKLARLRVPLHQASPSAPVTPQAAHSVAVAKPKMSEKNTVRMRIRQGISFADSASFCRNGIGGGPGGVVFPVGGGPTKREAEE